MQQLTDKVIWVTGASSGIGEALIYELARSNARLVLSSRNKQELERVASASGLTPDRYMVLPLDLTKPAKFEQHTEKVIKKFNRIDILINNGGVTQRSNVIDTEMKVYRDLLEINFLGNIALTKAVLPYMKKQQSGLMVVTSSVAGKFSTPLRSGYSAAKHALHGFYDGLRAEVYADGIKVLLVVPGYIKTAISVNALDGQGNRHGKIDAGQQQGIPVDECAKSIINAIKKEKEEVVIAGLKEKTGLFLKRFLPRLHSRVIRKTHVT